MTNQINKRDAVSTVATVNVEKIDNLVVTQVERSLQDLDGDISDLDSVIDLLKDRMVQDTNASFPISLARFAEIKLATRRQKNELIKTLIAYKTGEQAMRKRSGDASSSIQDILAGVGMGAVIGAGKLSINNPTEVERTDIIDAEVEIEDSETTVSNIIKGIN